MNCKMQGILFAFRRTGVETVAVNFSKILFPTDFSELSVRALDHVRTIVDRFGAELHCLYVVDEAYQYWSSMGPEGVPIGPPPQELLDLSKNRMERFCTEQLQGFSGGLITAVTLGRPFAEIIRYAAEKSIDLIVMSTHGRGAFAHMLLGSTTEKVVRKAPCAVLTVRGTDQKFELP